MSSSKIVAEGCGRPPKQARSRDKRERILDSAAEVFNQVGYAGSSLNLIAETAGVSKGAVQFHFSTKEEVAQAVVNEEHAVVMQLASEVSSTGAVAIEQTVMLSHMMAEQLIVNPIVRGGIRLTIEMSFTDSSPVEPFRDWVLLCESLLRRAKEDGDIAQSVDPVALANHVAGAFTGIQLLSHVLTKRADLHERVDYMWQHLLQGILEPSSEHRLDKIIQARWESHQNGSQDDHVCSTCGKLHR